MPDDHRIRELVEDALESGMSPEAACAELPLDAIRSPAVMAEAALQETLLKYARAGFDLTCEIPLRAQLFTLEPALQASEEAGSTPHNEHVLLLIIHHIACDGASLTALLEDLKLAYAARCADHSP